MAVAYSASAVQLNSYRTNSVLGLTPGQVLVKMYDLALVALISGDGKRSVRVLSAMIDSLDFEYQEIAMGLFRLYRYCIEEVNKGEYEMPTRILRELRETWVQALSASPQAGARC